MPDKLVTAWTPANMVYPPFFNITRLDDGGVRLMVRHRSCEIEGRVMCGVVASIDIPAAVWREHLDEAAAEQEEKGGFEDTRAMVPA